MSSFDDHLAAAAHGDGPAFRELYALAAAPVARYLRARGCDDVEGVTNEVFVRVFRSVGSFDGSEAQFRAWVFTIARNVLVDEHRRRARRVATEELGYGIDQAAVGGDVESEALDRDGEAWVQHVLAKLPPAQRDVLTLRILGDLTIDQVAEVMGKSRGAVKALQRRALTSVRRILSETGVPL